MEVYDDPMLVEVLTGIAGLKALNVVRILRSKKEMTDYELAHIMGMSWNKTRGILYNLNTRNVVRCRKMNDKRTGKTMYFWSLDEDRLRSLLIERRKETLQKLREKLSFEQENNFYSCITGCTRVQFDKAMEYEFMCPVCREPLNFQDNTVIVEELNSYIQHLESSLGVLA